MQYRRAMGQLVGAMKERYDEIVVKIHAKIIMFEKEKFRDPNVEE